MTDKTVGMIFIGGKAIPEFITYTYLEIVMDPDIAGILLWMAIMDCNFAKGFKHSMVLYKY